MSESASAFVQRIKAAGRYRVRQVYNGAPLIFCDNDYLDLSRHPAVVNAMIDYAQQWGVGARASQFVIGYQAIHQDLERAFADYLERDAALLFSTGYMANCGVMSAVLTPKDVVLADKNIHASLIDAVMMSRARLLRYPHLDVMALERLAQSHPEAKHIITDGVFSMTGACADLQSMAAIAAIDQRTLVVDDAHGLGVLGVHGRGAVEHNGLGQAEVPLLICPMGKALGVMGAVVAGDHDKIEYLTQRARSAMYTTALPPALAAAGLAALNVMRTEAWRRQKLHAHIDYFIQGASALCLPVAHSCTAIQSITFTGTSTAGHLAEDLARHNITVYPMRPPTVAAGSSLLRVTLSVRHTQAEIQYLLERLRAAYDTVL